MGAVDGPAGDGAHRAMRPASEEGWPGSARNRRAHGGSIAAAIDQGCPEPAERQAAARRAHAGGGRARAAACRLLVVLVLMAQLRGCSTWFHRYAN